MTSLNFDKKLTAFLIIDRYNDLISEGGKLWERLKAVADNGASDLCQFPWNGNWCLVFRWLMFIGFGTVLTIFACVEFGVGVLGLYAFRAEAPARG